MQIAAGMPPPRTPIPTPTTAPAPAPAPAPVPRQATARLARHPVGAAIRSVGAGDTRDAIACAIWVGGPQVCAGGPCEYPFSFIQRQRQRTAPNLDHFLFLR